MNISEMAWGVTLWFDLWAVGIAAGAFMTAFLINKMSGGRHQNLFRLAVYSGILFAMTGVILLLSHLGHIQWFWHMFVTFRPMSVLNLGGWILSGWLTVASFIAILWIAGNLFKGLRALSEKLTGPLSWAGFILSILLITYGGVLIGTTNQPLGGSTLMLPPFFVGSAVCTGLAWLILASFIANWATGVSALRGVLRILFGSADWKIEDVTMIARALLIALVLQLVILAGFMAWLAAAAPDSFRLLVSGDLALYFWVGLVGVGLVLPFFMLLYNWSKGISSGTAVAVAATSSLLTVAGGLILRAVILTGTQL